MTVAIEETRWPTILVISVSLSHNGISSVIRTLATDTGKRIKCRGDTKAFVIKRDITIYYSFLFKMPF